MTNNNFWITTRSAIRKVLHAQYITKMVSLVMCTLVLLPPEHSLADPVEQVNRLRLAYSDGRPEMVGLERVNFVLRSVGVRVSTVPLHASSLPILEASQTRAIDAEEIAALLSIFSLHRGQLLDEIRMAGRTPEAHRGGYLTTSEDGIPPYPKVYDMKAMSPEVKAHLQEKFGKLHVNSADNGIGIDEVMTIVSGGPWTWFFLLPDDVIGKLTLGFVGLDGPGWRISYPGLVPHGGFLDAEYGLVVAHAHGPERFVMRYDEPSVRGSKMLDTNSWIDFSGESPKLLDR